MTTAPYTIHAEPASGANWSAELEALHAEATRDHFIDVATRAALVEAITPAAPAGATIVDAGCSGGYLLADLRAALPGRRLIGLDLVPDGLDSAARLVPEAELMLASVTDLPLEDASVDAIVSANVLEHVADDEGALRELERVLRPRGRAALVVPYGPGLYDYYDRFLEHERRYARGELADKAARAGFAVLSDGFLGGLLYPPFWLTKQRNRRTHAGVVEAGEVERLVRADIARTRGSKLGGAAMSLERSLRSRGLGLPFGIRGLTVVEKLREL